jgi:hypothetical protein
MEVRGAGAGGSTREARTRRPACTFVCLVLVVNQPIITEPRDGEERTRHPHPHPPPLPFPWSRRRRGGGKGAFPAPAAGRMHSTNLLLEEPIRTASILEPSKPVSKLVSWSNPPSVTLLREREKHKIWHRKFRSPCASAKEGWGGRKRMYRIRIPNVRHHTHAEIWRRLPVRSQDPPACQHGGSWGRGRGLDSRSTDTSACLYIRLPSTSRALCAIKSDKKL